MTPWEADSHRNELTKTTVGGNDTIYKWDPRGNLTKKGSVEYYWDSQDKMTKVVNGAKTVQYKYDLLGRRVAKKVDNGAWWWYFYDGLKVLFEGSDTSSNRGYYTVTPAAVGGIVSRVTPGVRRFYHYDRLGNVMAITDVNGKPYAEYTMDAFGNVLQKGTSTGYSSEFATDPQPYHLTTKEYDADVALYYFNARWYDPATGRFVSRDEMVRPGENAYSFCKSNPTNLTDPSGMVWCTNIQICTADTLLPGAVFNLGNLIGIRHTWLKVYGWDLDFGVPEHPPGNPSKPWGNPFWPLPKGISPQARPGERCEPLCCAGGAGKYGDCDAVGMCLLTNWMSLATEENPWHWSVSQNCWTYTRAVIFSCCSN